MDGKTWGKVCGGKRPLKGLPLEIHNKTHIDIDILEGLKEFSLFNEEFVDVRGMQDLKSMEDFLFLEDYLSIDSYNTWFIGVNLSLSFSNQ